MISGVYKITAPNGNCYIGSTVKFNKRWSSHKSRLAHGAHHSPILQAAWIKYGAESFRFEKLLVCSREDLLFFEQRAVDVFKPKFNILPVAGSQYGYKQSDETRAKRSAANKGKRPSESAIAAAIVANTGRNPSAEARAKMASQKGRPITADVRAKIAASNTGLKRTPEQCERIRASQKGRIFSLETRKKMSESAKRAHAAARLNALVDYFEKSE